MVCDLCIERELQQQILENIILVKKLEQKQEMIDASSYLSEPSGNLFSSPQSSFFELDNITPSVYMHQNTIGVTKTLYDLRQAQSTKKVVENATTIAPIAVGVNLDNIKLSECSTQRITCKCTKNVYLNVSSYAIS